MGIFSAFLFGFIKSQNPLLLATPKWIHSFYQPKRKSSSLPHSPALPAPTALATLKTSLVNLLTSDASLVNLLTSDAVIPPPLPVEDYRRRKETQEFVDQQQKLKYQKRLEKKQGVRLGSRSERND
jgi:hypothetical protein